MLKAVFSEIQSQDMSSSCFPPKTKLLIGRPARSANQRPVFLRETSKIYVLTWILQKRLVFIKYEVYCRCMHYALEWLLACGVCNITYCVRYHEGIYIYIMLITFIMIIVGPFSINSDSI